MHSASSSPPSPFLPKDVCVIVSAGLKQREADVWGDTVVSVKQAQRARA